MGPPGNGSRLRTDWTVPCCWHHAATSAADTSCLPVKSPFVPRGAFLHAPCPRKGGGR